MTLFRTTTMISAGCLILGVLAACVPGGDPGADGSARPATSIETGTPSSASPTPAASDAGAEPAAPEVLATGLDAPWSVVPLPDGSVLVSERDSGRILRVIDGRTETIGEVEGVAHGGEGGLLGLALAPEPAGPAGTGDGGTGSDAARLYAYLTAADGNRVVSYALTGSGSDLALGERQDVLTGIPASGIHNGGRIAFGPDGRLYVSTGDASERPAAQDPDSLAGKILRLEPDGSVPEDNPTAGSPVYSLGHRNVQGLAWDDAGRLWASEFGANAWDELILIEPGGNYGWPEVEGFGGTGEHLEPERVWPTAEASPSGLAHVGGTLVLASLRGERLWAVEVPEGDPEVTGESDQLPAESLFAGEYGRIRDVVPDPAAGERGILFITNATDGRGDPGPDDDRLLRTTLP